MPEVSGARDDVAGGADSGTAPAIAPSMATTPLPAAERRREPAWQTLGCFALLLIALYLVAGPYVELPTWGVEAARNPGLMEAQAWLRGEIALEKRLWDTALFEGKAYNIYPPMFTFLSYAALHAGRLVGVPAGEFYSPWYVILVALPVPLTAFWAFHRVAGSGAFAAALAAGCICGTPLLPMLADARHGSINGINLVMASSGVMLLAGDLLGRRRIWPAVIGLLLAAWSRQLTLFFGAAIVIVALCESDRTVRRRKAAMALAGVALAAGVLMLLNQLRFGNPFDNGYVRIYQGDGRETQWYGERALEHGLFSPQFIPGNAYYMNLSPPRFRTSPAFIQLDNHNHGVSIWLTTPLLFGVLAGIRRWWRDVPSRALMLCSLPVILGHLMYHNPGTPQVGYFRFALDYMPVWLLVVAPWAVEARHRVFTIGCLAWSLLYFRMAMEIR